MAIIETRQLTKYYGQKRGILDVDLSVAEGEIFGFIGPNGAGKSTTIRTLLNFIYPTSGQASIFGLDCTKNSARIKRDVGYVPSEVHYYDNIKVSELLDYSESFYPSADRGRREQLCADFQVDLDKRFYQLSLGNKKKVAVVQALLQQPRLLILDEPTNGLDPLMQGQLLDILADANRQGCTVFFSSHNLAEVQKFCHRVAIIREGRIVETRKVSEMLATAVRQIRISSREAAALEQALLPLSASQLVRTGDQLDFSLATNIDGLIKTLAQFEIQDLQILEPSLQETFLQSYR